MFNDGNMQEDGGVGAGWWRQDKRGGYGIGLGMVATVWDGEIADFRGALTHAPKDKKLLILSDSQIAIVATKQAGRTGKARTRHLRWAVNEIERRKRELGDGAVELGWVKAHVGISGMRRQTNWRKREQQKSQIKTRSPKEG